MPRKPGLIFILLTSREISKQIRDIASERGIDTSTIDGQRQAAKEHFADLVQHGNINPSLWSRFVTVFKNALRRMGFKNEWLTKFDDNDIAEIIRESREAVEGNQRTFGERNPDINFSSTSVKPWPEDFPKIKAHTNLVTLKNNPFYKEAKAGNTEAAIQVVRALFKPEYATELAQKYPDAIIVPVRSVETSGHNRLPGALAHAISDGTGLKVDDSIFQTNHVGHTESNPLQRLLSRATFDGKVIPGQKYILTEDVSSTGGSLHELRHYIENNGGEVVAVQSLAVGQRGSTLAITPKVISEIERRFGREETNDFLRENNIAGNIEALTEGEGQSLLKKSFKTLDDIRAAIAEERSQGGRQNNEGSIQRPVSKLKVKPSENQSNTDNLSEQSSHYSTPDVPAQSPFTDKTLEPEARQHIQDNLNWLDKARPEDTGDPRVMASFIDNLKGIWKTIREGSGAEYKDYGDMSKLQMILATPLHWAAKFPVVKQIFGFVGQLYNHEHGAEDWETGRPGRDRNFVLP